MKKLTLIFTLLFSTVMFSSSSYAGWKPTAQSLNEDVTKYVDFERIRKHGGYVYYWSLADYPKPLYDMISSDISYIKADCKLFRQKKLNMSFYKRRMGKGIRDNHIDEPDKNWTYPPPESISEIVLKAVCRYAN